MKARLLILAILALAVSSWAQTSVNYAPATLSPSCSAVTTTGACSALRLAGNSLAYGVTWQISYDTGTASAINVTARGSNDNSTWTVLDTNTTCVTTGGSGCSRSFAVTGAYIYLDCNVVTYTKGTTNSTTCSFTVNPNGSQSGGSGLISINSDNTPAQTLVQGTNITITDNGGGSHTIAASGGGTIATTPDVLKGDNSGNAVASTIVDSGSAPTQTPEGLDTVTVGVNHEIPNAGTGGTAANKLVIRNSSGAAITALTSTVSGIEGTANGGAGTTGSVTVCYTSGCVCLFDNQTAVGDWAIPSTTTAGECHDSGSTSQIPQKQNFYITSVNSGATTTATVDILTPDVISGGTTGTPPGNVFGPASAASGDGACFNGTTGKVIKDCGYNALEKPIMSAWNSLSSAAAQYFSSGYSGTIPANWSGTTAGTSVLACKTLPSGTITWTVKDETASTTLGTFAITSGGTVTLATTGGSTATVTAGNVVSVTPSGTDSSAIGCVFTGYFTVTGP